MPTKKQRRRQQKSRRHEYEYVYVDDDGNEVAVDPSERKAEKDKNGARQSKAAKDNNRQPSQTGRRRAIEPPSWRRSGKRALVLGPLLVVAMMFFNRNLSLVEQIAPALFLIAFFIPFSYFTDSLAYRMYKKRLDRRDAAKTAK